jgi:hypothetical protein
MFSKLTVGVLLVAGVASSAMAQERVAADLGGATYAPEPVITVPNIVTTYPNPGGTGYNAPAYQSPYGGSHDGVARLLMRNAAGTPLSGCTGSLLWTGWDILTAAHCVNSAAVASVTVSFLNPSGGLTNIASASIVKMPGYTGAVVDGRDIAIIRLSREADAWMDRYMLHTGPSLYQNISFVGFGLTGNGNTGGQFSTQFCDIQPTNPNCLTPGVPTRRHGQNSWESAYDGSFLYNYEATPIFLSDFDSGLASHNLLCNSWTSANPPNLAQICHAGYGANEVGISSGDSGGPAFIGGRIAGVASFGSAHCRNDVNPPDVAGDGCPVGQERVVGPFGGYAGHVSTTWGENVAFINATVTPEPGTYALLATGLLGVFGMARRRRSK